MKCLKRKINSLKNLFSTPRKKKLNNTIEENIENLKINNNLDENNNNNHNELYAENICAKNGTLNINNINKSKKKEDFLQKIEDIVQKEKISDKEKKRVIKIFENFLDFLIKIKKNREITKNIKFRQSNIINRIKINDVDNFIKIYYKSSTPSTITYIKIKMR